PGLRVVCDAEETFQQTLAADGVKHLKRVKAFPRPVLDALAFGALSESFYGAVGGGTEKLVVGLISSWQPFCGTFGENPLEKRSAAPLVKACVLSKVGFEQEDERA